MKTAMKSAIFALILVGILLIADEMATSTTPSTAEVKQLSGATNQFAWDLYQNLVSKSPNENVFFSPLSIGAALGMTYLGARKDTAQQIANVLRFDQLHPDRVHPTFGEALSHIQRDSPGFTLHTANKLFANKKFTILESFIEDTKNYYKAGAERHDFVGDAEGSRQKINTWVEEETNAKIKDLLPEGSIDALTALILVNAIYFKGDWKSKFEKERTADADFVINSSKKATVPLMFQKQHYNFGYSDDFKAHAIQIPYVDERLSLFVVLPEFHQKTVGPLEVLQNLENKLSSADLKNLTETFRMRELEVHLWLPRFRLETTENLKHHLPGMGMNDLFDMVKADLSGLDPSNNVFVSDVFHKAFIDVNEEGSEAAAATAVRIQMRSLPRVHEFKANHPFLFYLQDNITGLILFMGRMVNPGTDGSSGHTEL